MTWFDWLFVISCIVIGLISVFCWIYTIIDLFRKKY